MSTPSVASLPAAWSDPFIIDDHWSRDVVVDGNSIYVLGDVGLKISHDSGTSWHTLSSQYSRIFVDEGIIYRASVLDAYSGVFWADRSTDGGYTWSEPVPILVLEGDNEGCYGIYKFGTRLIFYTLDGNPGGDDPGAMVKVAWSDDEGSTWSVPVLVDEGLYVEDPFPNDVLCAYGVLYLTYYDQTPGYDNVEVIVAKSADMGETWTNAVAAVGPNAHNPIITADLVSGELYVTYLSMIVLPDWTLVDSGPFFVKSLDGISWSAPVRIGTITLGTDQVGFHWLVAAGGMVFEAYLDYKGPELLDSYDVRMSGSEDDGITWSDMGDVTGLVSNSLCPMLAITPGVLHLFWRDCGADSPWYVEGSTYYRFVPLGNAIFAEATVARQGGGSPAKDAVTLSYTPKTDGQIWISAVSSDLKMLKVDFYLKSPGKPKLLSSQCLVFGLKNPGALESSKIDVSAGYGYSVRVTPMGTQGSSAHVTGLFAAG